MRKGDHRYQCLNEGGFCHLDNRVTLNFMYDAAAGRYAATSYNSKYGNWVCDNANVMFYNMRENGRYFMLRVNLAWGFNRKSSRKIFCV